MKKLFLLLFAYSAVCLGQNKITETEIAVNPLIKGTLFTPDKMAKEKKLVILIAGSGPTNRSGNQTSGANNSLRFLAQGIAAQGVSVYSYDKRIFALMIAGNLDEKSLSFSDFIGDAKDVIAYFKATKNYSKIIIAGHSEGSLIGMVAANANADGFISLAGPGRSIDAVLGEQLDKQLPPAMKAEAAGYLAQLKEGKTFELKNPALASIFRESVQPYMISWMKYVPEQEIKKLNIPVLLVNGTKDLQVPATDAELLKKAKPDARLVIIPGMNHIFKEIKTDDAENLATYSNPDLPVMPQLLEAVNQFLKSI